MLNSVQEADYLTLIKAEGKYSCLAISLGTYLNSEELIKLLINYLLCLNPKQTKPCLMCDACKLYSTNNNPDIHYLTASSDAKYIKVEDVRQVINLVLMAPNNSRHQVVYVPNIKELNLNSANALLKIIEEPPSYLRFILCGSSLNSLLPTLKSRSFKYHVTKPNLNDLIKQAKSSQYHELWLSLFNNEPFFTELFSDDDLQQVIKSLNQPSLINLFALSSVLDPKTIELEFTYQLLQAWFSDLFSLKLKGEAYYFKGLIVPSLVSRVNLEKLSFIFDELAFLQQWLNHPLNHKLQLEKVLVSYQQAFN